MITIPINALLIVLITINSISMIDVLLIPLIFDIKSNGEMPLIVKIGLVLFISSIIMIVIYLCYFIIKAL